MTKEMKIVYTIQQFINEHFSNCAAGFSENSINQTKYTFNINQSKLIVTFYYGSVRDGSGIFMFISTANRYDRFDTVIGVSWPFTNIIDIGTFWPYKDNDLMTKQLVEELAYCLSMELLELYGYRFAHNGKLSSANAVDVYDEVGNKRTITPVDCLQSKIDKTIGIIYDKLGITHELTATDIAQFSTLQPTNNFSISITGMLESRKCDKPEITNVIFNEPATIVFWSDGTKTIVKCTNGETFDKEKGLMAAILKKTNGNDYYKDIKKWIKKSEK